MYFVKLGKHIDQCGLIFDMEGIGMAHLWKPGKWWISMNLYYISNVIETPYIDESLISLPRLVIDTNWPLIDTSKGWAAI